MTTPITYHRLSKLYVFATPQGAEGSAPTRAEAERVKVLPIETFDSGATPKPALAC